MTAFVPDASRISPPVLLPGCPNPVRIALADGVMRDVASSLHAVVVSRRDAQVIEVQPDERLDRDFFLRWRSDGSELASSLVCADDVGGGRARSRSATRTTSCASSRRPPRNIKMLTLGDRSGSHGSVAPAIAGSPGR